jgi:AAA+ superfamily predicted ATPase
MDTQLIVIPTVNATKKSAAPKHSPFTSYSEVLAQAERLFQVRELWQDAMKNDRNEVVIERKEKRYRKLRIEWHARCKSSVLPLCRQAVELGLSDLEVELLWGVLSLHVGEGKSTHNNQEITELFSHIAIERRDRLSAIKLLESDAPLLQHKLVFTHDDSDGDPLKNEIFPEVELLQEVLGSKPNPQNYWMLQEEHELYSALRKLFRLLESNADDFGNYLSRGSNLVAFKQRSRQIEREWQKFEETLKRHPKWSWNRPEIQALPFNAVKILVALTARALDILPDNYSLFTGQGLASMLLHDVQRHRSCYTLLRPQGILLSEQWIRPITEDSQHYTGVDAEIEKTRFELDDRAFEILNLERPKRNSLVGITVREPRIKLDQLALSPQIEEAIHLTLTQAKAEHRLLHEWGIAERIQYGLHPVLLFFGPPGTGKTACAEALAHELGRPLIVADYSKIQNCFIGVTEKNIVRIFQEAQRKNAVLFWDEADAMLYDRDDTSRNWEVRDVNVILQEIERFAGVCILATNRRQNLDKALARRISMQVEFPRPQTAVERLRIWQAILPPQLPLAADVDLKLLAHEDLSGGEIKNVMLNAARFAAARGDNDAKLTFADFDRAVRWELQARQERTKPIGF